MSYAAVPTLRHAPELAARYEPGLRARTYQFGLTDPETKRGLLAGMSMTEKQGGSDVRAGTTLAVPDPAVPGGYRLTGHKWFTSAPMNDLFLTLAQAPEGLTCFLLPRVLPGGERNAIRLQRLKDKLGNRSNASSEIEYDGAFGALVGEPGRGVATIIQMVTMTRLDCVLGSAGQLRAAVSEATHHAAHRVAFGRALIDQPAMTAVLADLAVESWAATLTAIRLARAVDGQAGDPAEAALLRLALPVAKFWVCKRTVPSIAEALECLGGNGYVEESVMPRLLRESPLNGLWEGSGNITALDAIRAVRRSPDTVDALMAELSPAKGSDASFDAALRALTDLLPGNGTELTDADARPFASLAARLFAASRLLRSAPPEVAALYCTTRLGSPGDRVFGELPTGYPVRDIVAAVTPQVG
jgi:putative acyl-CoA dehydrogenase